LFTSPQPSPKEREKLQETPTVYTPLHFGRSIEAVFRSLAKSCVEI
jgi:hypothetical protein